MAKLCVFCISATDKDDLEICNSKKDASSDESESGPKLVTIGSRGSLQTLFVGNSIYFHRKGGQPEAILNVLEGVPCFVIPKLLDACSDMLKSIPRLQMINSNVSSFVSNTNDSSTVDATSIMISGGNVMSSQSNMNSVTSVLSAWVMLAKLYKSLVLRNSSFIESVTNDIDTRRTVCENIGKFVEEATFIAIAAARSASGGKDNDMKPLVEELETFCRIHHIPNCRRHTNAL